MNDLLPSGYELYPLDYGFLVAGGMMVLLAIVLMVVGLHDRLNRAFALFLAVRGALNIADTYLPTPGLREPSHVTALFTAIHPWLEIGVVFATAHFVIAYHARYVSRRPRAWMGTALLAAALFAEALYAYDHDLYAAFPGGQFGAPGAVFGPLFLLSTARNLSYAFVAALFLRHALKETIAPLRASLVLVGVGFLLEPLARGVVVAVNLFDGQSPRAEFFKIFPWWDTAGYLLALLLCAVAIVPLVRLSGESILARRSLVASGLVVAVAVVNTPFANDGARAGVVVETALAVFVLLALPALAAYALLRHQLFDLDVKLKWTLRRSTLAGLFVAVFLVATQLAENYLDSGGVVVGGIATGLLLFALTPLQRLADRVANTALPGVKSAGEMDADERLALYEDQVRFAWSDGRLDTSERALLSRLRDRLGLSFEEAARIEDLVAQDTADRSQGT